MGETVLPSDAEITLRRISALTVCDVCELSETLSDEQRNMVADNGTSIAEAHFSENACSALFMPKRRWSASSCCMKDPTGTTVSIAPASISGAS
ncbi:MULTISPECIES: hypothetical protein [unclassified Ensifer]|uniref:hypothetical protein n=1 Tax=unclassified Ensifer TaxID=2633371 RepID=UPI001FEF3389|nr:MULTISPECIES: hypothetical protein [unclassified Ensifer]